MEGNTTTGPMGASAVQDRVATSYLKNAMTAARWHYTDQESYLSFSPQRAASIEPELTWSGDRRATPGVVTINYARGSLLVMSTRSESGQAFCIADEADLYVPGRGPIGQVSYGTRDAFGATSPRECGPKDRS